MRSHQAVTMPFPLVRKITHPKPGSGMARAGSRGPRRVMEQRWADELMSLCTSFGLGSWAQVLVSTIRVCLLACSSPLGPIAILAR